LKHLLVLILTICLTMFISKTTAQDRSFGMGIMLGEPTGLSAKLWTSSTTAFDFGVGLSIGGDRIGVANVYYNGDNRVHLHFDYLLHAFNAVGSTDEYPIYYGMGVRFNTGGGYYNSLAVRFVLGLAWMPHDTPIDMFIEFVPSLQLTSEPAFAMDSAVGLRYYF